MIMEEFAKQGGFYDIIKEDRILKGYRHSRYFNLLWFRKNHFVANRILTFGDEVKDILDNSKYIIFRSTYGNVINFKFSNIKTDQITNISIHRDSHNVLNVRKKDAFYNPFVWVVANQLKYIEWPKKWEQIAEIGRTTINKIFIAQNIETQENIIRIKNKFHKVVDIKEDDLDLITDFGIKYRKLSNLKQFFPTGFSKKVLIASKKTRKDLKGHKKGRKMGNIK